MNDKAPDPSTLVGATKMAKICGHSRNWARAKLREWLEEQNRGGAQRIVMTGSKKNIPCTTIAVIQREFLGSVRDPMVMRKLNEHDRDLDHLARRNIALSDELREVKAELSKLKSHLFRRAS